MQQHQLQQSRLDDAGYTTTTTTTPATTTKSYSSAGPPDGGISISARSADSSNTSQNQQSMGKITITLENSTVHAGTTLRGRISVVSSKSEVEKILLKFDGVGTVRLDADNGKTYSAQEIYLCDRMPLWSRRENATPDVHWGKGVELTVPFEYPLQSDAQASFDGHYARILYTCTAVAKYAGALGKKQQAVSRFLVLPPLNSNFLKENVSGQKVQKRKTFSSFGIKDGQVEVELDMDKVCVERGDQVGLTVTVNNESQLHLRSLKFGIIQLVTSIAKGRQVVEKHAIIEFDENVYLKPTEIWQGRRICTINKNLQPTVIARGNRIDCRVSYCFFVTVIPPNFSNSLELTHPLFIY